MASIRKREKKFQAIIRRTGHETISRTFTLRKNAIEWARDIELKADRMGMPKNLKVLEQTTLADMLIKYRDTVIPQKRSPKNETIIINALEGIYQSLSPAQRARAIKTAIKSAKSGHG